ncbi:MAG: bifunctional DNA-formamidopyrimidine glycosylase/DNA-(apurinic or apyrimidinic site) lyase [Nitrospira sp.]|nr:bifunctional DNA-formamidopyrimidine glycosylase/DNA-(apurinic or apyrimidinic site) lyase [Nitrospira sp.]MBH0180166.1 bifunctional DNA-formamidopyrimidine glycosylase/DNA-(apurinic or apyrimidinic site) lyase [Nitrospira sp.]MBH0185957.1 bifunctional DNA-formamidopyrimidine glycosylase/DNA-(apurinic or apyrimidinic site) lyase [Nitrospira sp.]MBH0189130.1 bifunctional DNA-formamidopyrimidine glycosylase/DNA-(apurinic or apyrimidinic site) lyase [Nitrospira sp.]
MPELPEAEVVAGQIRAALIGACLTDCWVGRKDIVREGLASRSWYTGAVVQHVQRYGKSVAIQFGKNQAVRYIVAELGMTGLLLFSSVQIRHPQHVHVRMTFSGGREPEVRYWNPRRFGRLSLLDQEGLNRYVARRFGCDPLTVSLEEFYRLLKNRRGRLKPLLMHQQAVAGIGNIYANEILFRAGLHPNVQADRLSAARVERLFHVTQEVLHSAIACGGSSVRDFFAPDGTEGQYRHRHAVYGKEEQPCPNLCGRRIRRVSDERSSFFCPQCQNPRKWK